MDDMKQTCLDLADSAGKLFDLIEEKGDDAPLNDHEGIFILKDIMDRTEKIRGYYMRRNIMRMLALGVSPSTLLQMAGEGDVLDGS